MRIDEFCMTFDDRHAGILEQRLVDAVQSPDFLIFVCNELFPVETAFAHGPAETGGVFEIGSEMRSIDEQLFRYATDIHAGTAEVTLFGNGHSCSVAGGHATGAN